MKCDVKYTVQLLESNALQMIFSNLTFNKFMSYICRGILYFTIPNTPLPSSGGEIINFTEIGENAICIIGKKSGQKPPVQIVSQLFVRVFVRGLLSGGLLSGRFCPGWFLSVPTSVRTHLLQQKVKNHFKFHVSYVIKKIISVTSHALDHLPCRKLSHFLRPLPLERDVLYRRPLKWNLLCLWCCEIFCQGIFGLHKSGQYRELMSM